MKLKKLLLPVALSMMAAFTGVKARAQVSDYVFAQSSGAFTPVSASGTIVANATGTTTTFDTEGWDISLPFAFQFNGGSYTSIFVNSNGGATFGTTTSTGSSLISSTTSYDGALAVMNRDLWAMFVTEGTRTTGSTTITGVTNFTGLDVGDTLVGTGIPVGTTTVVSFDPVAGTIEMSAASTSDQTAAAVRWPAGSIRTEVLGSAPNRTFVIEWNQFSDYSTAVNNTTFDFQIHLEETSNIVRFVYGPFASTLSTSRTNQVGLRGSSNADYNNRTAVLADGFNNTTTGTSNSATVARDNTNFPAPGLTFSWTPPTCLAPSGISFATISNSGATVNWTASTSAPNGGYEYEVRSSGAPGSGATGLEASGTTSPGATTETVTGLTSATPYTFYIRSDCGGGDYSNWTTGATFTTACNTVSAPFAEGFNTGTLPSCWTNSNSISSTTANLLWKFTGAPGYGTASNGRPNGTFAWLDASSPYNAVVTLTSPIIDLSSLASPYVKFDWFKDNQDTPPFTNNSLKLEGYDGSAWVTLFDDTSNANTWRTERITLPAAFVGVTNAQFRFSVDKSLSNDFYDDVLLDSFMVMEAPTCLPPSSPAITNITASSATLSWTASTSAPNGGYEYEVRSSGTAGSGATGLEASGITAGGSTAANITGLSATTTYTAYVRSVCGAGDSSVWVPTGAFTTACNTFTAPFMEGFNAGALPNCWTNSNSISSTSATLLWKFTGTPGYGTANNGRPNGTFAWVDASSPYTAVVELTSPIIDLSSLASPYVKFDWYKNNSSSSSSTVPPNYPSNNLKLEGYDGTTWVTLFDDTTNAANWRTERITLPASFAGISNAQFRFSVDKTLSNYQYDDVLLDSFSVINTPSCLPPVTPVVTNVTANSATLSWTASTSAPNGGYEYEVRTSGAAGSGTTGLVTSGNTASGSTAANLTSLTPTTTYTAYVRSICGAGDSSVWVPTSTFTTACATFVAPFMEGFNTGSLPSCWTNSNSISSTSATLLWKFSGTPGYGTANNGRPNGTFAWVDASSPYTAVVELTSPIIDLSSLASPYVKFDWYKNNSSSSSSTVPPNYPSNNLKLEGYDGTTWVTLFDDTTNVAAWRTERITLPASFSGVTNAQFRFSVDKTLSNYQYDDVLLDSFSVMNTPSCLPPDAPIIANVTSNSATLNWTASTSAPNGGYQYEVRSSGAAGSGATGLAASGNTAAGSTTANITGLSPAATYMAYVRAICGAGDSSVWVPSSSFQTACGVVTAPYMEGFDLGSLPPCWTNTNSISSTTANLLWKFTGAPGYGASTALNGRTAGTFAWVDASSPYNAVVELTTPVIDLSALATPAVKFDWFKNNSSSSTTTTPPNYPSNNLKLEGYDGTTWVTLFNDTTNANTWRTENITLPAAFAGVTNAQFRFSVDKSLSNYFYDDVLLDSFEVMSASPVVCAAPTGVTASSITANSATISWTAPTPAPALGYEYSVRSGSVVASGNTAAGVTSAAVSGLAASSTDTVYVRSICAQGDTSAWSTPYVFQTSGAPCTAPVVNLGNDTAFCAGNYLNLDAGNAGSTYLWSTGATIQSIDVTTSGTYSVAVTNAAGCTGRDTITVTVNPVPVVALGPDVSICSGNSLTLDAGTQGPNATYLWSTGATSQTLSVATAGSYSVTVTNGSGCIGRDTINVTTGTAPVVALGNDTAFCVGGALTLDAGNQATGTTYMWSTGANTQAITVAASGTYSVAVTNAGGCIGRDTINVTVNPRPVVNLGNDTAICAGSSLTLSAGTQGANATYMWNNGATTQSITVTPAASGFYAVNVMDNGCSGFDTIQVTVNPIPVVALGNDTTFCTGSSITLNAGNIGATYLWSTGANTQAVTVSAAGSYSVAVMANGCTGYDTIQVGVTPLPTAGTISVNNTSAATYTFSVTGMQNASSYGWRFGDGAADTARTATHTYTSNGTYTVTFYAVNNCGMDSVSTTITVTTGVANVNLDGQVSLYPNPAADFVTVENTAAQAMKTIRILDVAGALVSEVKATGASTQRLDVSNLASGTYLVRIELEGGAIALRRLQVKH